MHYTCITDFSHDDLATSHVGRHHYPVDISGQVHSKHQQCTNKKSGGRGNLIIMAVHRECVSGAEKWLKNMGGSMQINFNGSSVGIKKVHSLIIHPNTMDKPNITS